MKCATKKAGKPCRMPALRDRKHCWAHDPETAAARLEASSKGGSRPRRGRPPVPSMVPEPTLVPFEVGQLERRTDIPRALLRVARAAAAGELDVRRARLLGELLRGAAFAFSIAPDDAPADDEAPIGARRLTDAEIDFMVANGGRLPAGVATYGSPREFWVTGPEWHGPNGNDEDSGNADLP